MPFPETGSYNRGVGHSTLLEGRWIRLEVLLLSRKHAHEVAQSQCTSFFELVPFESGRLMHQEWVLRLRDATRLNIYSLQLLRSLIRPFVSPVFRQPPALVHTHLLPKLSNRGFPEALGFFPFRPASVAEVEYRRPSGESRQVHRRTCRWFSTCSQQLFPFARIR